LPGGVVKIDVAGFAVAFPTTGKGVNALFARLKPNLHCTSLIVGTIVVSLEFRQVSA
jgi:hypothetical protein